MNLRPQIPNPEQAEAPSLEPDNAAQQKEVHHGSQKVPSAMNVQVEAPSPATPEEPTPPPRMVDAPPTLTQVEETSPCTAASPEYDPLRGSAMRIVCGPLSASKSENAAEVCALAACGSRVVAVLLAVRLYQPLC